MKLNRQSSTVLKVQPIGDYPHDIPTIDAEALRRVPGLEAWYSSLQKWWFEFRTVLRRREEEVLQPVNGLKVFETDTNKTIEELRAQIAALAAQLAALTGNVHDIDLSALEAQVASLVTITTNLDTRVTILEGKVATLETEVAALPSRDRYEFEQVSPVADVTIEHPLNRKVNATIMDLADNIQRYCWFQNVDDSHVRFRFNGTKTFRAILS